MSVSCYFGLTESGKSYHVKNHVLPKWARKVVFDIAHCFEGDVVLTAPDDKKLTEIFRKFARISSYTIVIRPSRNCSEEKLFNKSVQLACALGRTIATKSPENRVQFVCDEADFVCSPHYQSRDLKHIVNKGRHDNVDCHFIARNPNRLHTDIRANCTKIVTFFLNNASEIQMFISNFSRGIVAKIAQLPKYWRFEWQDNGSILVFNDKNENQPNFIQNSPEIKSKNKGLKNA